MQFSVGIEFITPEFLVVSHHASCIYTDSGYFVPKMWIFLLQLELIFLLSVITKCGAKSSESYSQFEQIKVVHTSKWYSKFKLY
jgi:hypothetical protein